MSRWAPPRLLRASACFPRCRPSRAPGLRPAALLTGESWPRRNEAAGLRPRGPASRRTRPGLEQNQPVGRGSFKRSFGPPGPPPVYVACRRSGLAGGGAVRLWRPRRSASRARRARPGRRGSAFLRSPPGVSARLRLRRACVVRLGALRVPRGNRGHQRAGATTKAQPILGHWRGLRWVGPWGYVRGRCPRCAPRGAHDLSPAGREPAPSARGEPRPALAVYGYM